jgi:hypothetical protein
MEKYLQATMLSLIGKNVILNKGKYHRNARFITGFVATVGKKHSSVEFTSYKNILFGKNKTNNPIDLVTFTSKRCPNLRT